MGTELNREHPTQRQDVLRLVVRRVNGDSVIYWDHLQQADSL